MFVCDNKSLKSSLEKRSVTVASVSVAFSLFPVCCRCISLSTSMECALFFLRKKKNFNVKTRHHGILIAQSKTVPLSFRLYLSPRFDCNVILSRKYTPKKFSCKKEYFKRKKRRICARDISFFWSSISCSCRSTFGHPLSCTFCFGAPSLTRYHVYLRDSYISPLILWRDAKNDSSARCLGVRAEEGSLGKIGGDASRLDATSWWIN